MKTTKSCWSRGRTLGRGSSATVSLASSPVSAEVFAVKSAELACSAALQLEQQILASLDCPNIISYLGFEISPEYYNLFIEYAPGGSLSDEIKKGGLDEAAIKDRTFDILAGLAYLHAKGFAHCDIKGDNILIGAEGQAKIGDFGCARSLAAVGDRRMSGTPMFMAPEVARGEEQGAEADVWALGCTVIEMATGRSPWPDAANPVSALHRIAFSSDVPEKPEWLSEKARDFLSKCLVRDPKGRWTAEQLLKHPFVSSSSGDLKEKKWISPKSTLDKNFWDSFSEDDEEMEQEKEQEQAAVDPAERIRALAALAMPEWTWDDESWITIRSNGEELADFHSEIIIAEASTSYSETERFSVTPCDSFVSIETEHGFSMEKEQTLTIFCTDSDANFDPIKKSFCNRIVFLHFRRGRWFFFFFLSFLLSFRPKSPAIGGKHQRIFLVCRVRRRVVLFFSHWRRG